MSGSWRRRVGFFGLVCDLASFFGKKGDFDGEDAVWRTVRRDTASGVGEACLIGRIGGV
jgi:hypothetical protein